MFQRDYASMCILSPSSLSSALQIPHKIKEYDYGLIHGRFWLTSACARLETHGIKIKKKRCAKTATTSVELVSACVWVVSCVRVSGHQNASMCLFVPDFCLKNKCIKCYSVWRESKVGPFSLQYVCVCKMLYLLRGCCFCGPIYTLHMHIPVFQYCYWAWLRLSSTVCGIHN